MAGGEHIMCSPQVLGNELSIATNAEVESEKRDLEQCVFLFAPIKQDMASSLKNLRKTFLEDAMSTQRPYMALMNYCCIPQDSLVIT